MTDKTEVDDMTRIEATLQKNLPTTKDACAAEIDVLLTDIGWLSVRVADLFTDLAQAQTEEFDALCVASKDDDHFVQFTHPDASMSSHLSQVAVSVMHIEDGPNGDSTYSDAIREQIEIRGEIAQLQALIRALEIRLRACEKRT